jgi:hypothetical protein
LEDQDDQRNTVVFLYWSEVELLWNKGFKCSIEVEVVEYTVRPVKIRSKTNTRVNCHNSNVSVLDKSMSAIAVDGQTAW